jgi:hypothetical protein
MSGRRGSAAVLVAGTLALAVAGCAVAIGGPEVSSRAKCDGSAFTSDELPAAPPRTLVLVELARNDVDSREAVWNAVEPVVSEAVVEGGVIRLLVSGGEGESIEESPCLDGTSTIFVDRNNPETERKARATAVKAIGGDVSAMLEEIRIAPQGNLTNLLATIPEELRSLRGGDGEAGPLSVLLVSDLTSPASAGDCLDLDGTEDSKAYATEIVARCLESGQLRPLPEEVSLRIVRPQLNPGDNAAALLGGFLQESLCAQLTNDNGGCAPGPAGRD